MKTAKTFFSSLCVISVLSSTALMTQSCDKDDNKTEKIPVFDGFVLSVDGESTEYILLTDVIDSGTINISENVKELDMSGYTWIFNDSPSVGIGLYYNQSNPGLCVGVRLNSSGYLEQFKSFQIASRYTSYGFFQDYLLTSVGGQTPMDSQGSPLIHNDGTERSDGVTFNMIPMQPGNTFTDKTIQTLDITGNGDQATFSGIVDMGNGEFLTSLVVSQPTDESQTGGSSSGTVNYPDSCWVAAFDAKLNLKRIYRSDKISYSSGRYRSQYYSQMARTDNGDVYVFSGSYESTTTKPAGAIRIKEGATEFDPGYYFNIEDLTGGYRFKRLWYITDTYFLLEFYNDGIPAILGASTLYGIANVDENNKGFKWVTGAIPSSNNIEDNGTPLAHDGKIYLPLTAKGQDPAIYVIDPVTAVAAKGLTVSGSGNINGIGRLTANSGSLL